MNILFKNDDHVKKIYQFISLSPFFISYDQTLEIKNATESVGAILKKTIFLFQKNIDVRNFFGFSEEYINLAKNCYSKENLFLSRFDGYIDSSNNIKFLEFNTDYPGSIIRLDTVHETIYDFLNITNYQKNNNFLLSFIKLAKKSYLNNKKKNDVFVIGYGSWHTDEKKYTLNFLKKCLQNEGIPAEVAQWKEITAKDGFLYYDDRIISVLFRAELSERIVSRDYDSYQKILDVALKNNIFIYNPTSTLIAGSKNIMALWFTDLFQNLLTAKEKSIINKFIPKTYFINEDNQNYIINNKNNFVLKPNFGHGGQGIVIGKNEHENKWKDVVKIALNKKDYIAQEYIKPMVNKIDILDLQKNKISSNIEVNINVNPWYCSKKMIGISGRFAKNDIINIKQGGGSLPIYYKDK